MYVPFWKDSELAFSRERWLNSQNSLPVGEILLEAMTGSVVLSEVDVLEDVVLRKAEKHVRCGHQVGTTECATL